MVTYAQPIDPMTGEALGPRRIIKSTHTPIASSAPVDDDQPYPTGGSVADVLAWVGYDPDRAKAALAVEHGRGKPRKQLLTGLSERTGP